VDRPADAEFQSTIHQMFERFFEQAGYTICREFTLIRVNQKDRDERRKFVLAKIKEMLQWKLALVAKAGAGKTTLANMLIAEHGYVQLAFATKIKKMFRDLYGRDPDKNNPAERALCKSSATRRGLCNRIFGLNA
jgi:ABC-type molybdenum transport system ATPase subunit/photorepair protein PhrA